MRLAVVGVGSAGCRIVNRILDVEDVTGRNLCDGNALLIDSKETEFDIVEHVADDRRLLIGDIHREIEGHDIDGDPDLGAEIARDDQHEINRSFDAIEFHRVDGVLVVAGLGGGTGGGAGAVVIEQLQAISDKPVYALGVLPHEEEGEERALTAARSLQSFVERADNVLVFDNDAWASGKESSGTDYGQTNVELATRIVTLFAAGEMDLPTAAENRMDPSDIIRALETGGISSIGFASTDVSDGPKGVRAWFRSLSWPGLPWRSNGQQEEPPKTDAAKINRLVRRASRSKLTLPCEISSADRALIQLSGPPSALSRKGFESGRYWLEQEADTVEVMAGDEPHAGSSTLTAVILLSNVTEVPRIDEMQEQAVST